jgi:hypothetical protein
MPCRVSFRIASALGPLVRLLAIPLLALGAAGCLPADDAPESLADRPVPAAELEGVVFEGFEAGRRDVVVRSRSASVDPTTRIATLEAVQIAKASAS